MRLILCFLLLVLLTLTSIATQAGPHTSEGNQSGEQQGSNATATGSIEMDPDASDSPDTASAGIGTAIQSDTDNQEGKRGNARNRKGGEFRLLRRGFRPPSPPSGHTDPSPFK